MNVKELFKKYHTKLKAEGWLKAAICGLIGSFSISLSVLIFALAARHGLPWLWLNATWISACIGLATTPIIPLIYLRFFRPTVKMVAERIDRLGLQERFITMMELEKDDSFIAGLQRQDAKERLRAISTAKLKLALFRAPIVAVITLAVLTISVMTFMLPGVNGGLLDPEYSLSYYVEISEENPNGGGVIMGKCEQKVKLGKDSEEVQAVADEGYMFVEWSDGFANAIRQDKEVKSDIVVYARFVKLDNGEGHNGDEVPGDGDPNLDGESENEDPTKNTTTDGESEDTETGNEGDPEKNPDENGEGENEDGSGEEPEREDIEGILNSEPIVDGNTPYRTLYEQYLQDALARIEAGEEVSDQIKELIELYYGIIV